jgi:hypothetical protein
MWAEWRLALKIVKPALSSLGIGTHFGGSGPGKFGGVGPDGRRSRRFRRSVVFIIVTDAWLPETAAEKTIWFACLIRTCRNLLNEREGAHACPATCFFLLSQLRF